MLEGKQNRLKKHKVERKHENVDLVLEESVENTKKRDILLHVKIKESDVEEQKKEGKVECLSTSE